MRSLSRPNHLCVELLTISILTIMLTLTGWASQATSFFGFTPTSRVQSIEFDYKAYPIGSTYQDTLSVTVNGQAELDDQGAQEPGEVIVTGPAGGTINPSTFNLPNGGQKNDIDVTFPTTKGSNVPYYATIWYHNTAFDPLDRHAAHTISTAVNICLLKSFTVTNALKDTLCSENTADCDRCFVATTNPTISATLTAVLDPSVSASDLPPTGVTWTGDGTAGATQLQRVIPRTLINQDDLDSERSTTAHCGTSDLSGHLHVVLSSALSTDQTVVNKVKTGESTVTLPELGKFETDGLGSHDTDAELKNDSGTYKWHFKLNTIDMRYKTGVYSGAARTNVNSGQSFPLYCFVHSSPTLDTTYNFAHGSNITSQIHYDVPDGPGDDGTYTITGGTFQGDLAPGTGGSNYDNRPSCSKYFSTSIIQAHENYHRDDLHTDYTTRMQQLDVYIIQTTIAVYGCHEPWRKNRNDAKAHFWGLTGAGTWTDWQTVKHNQAWEDYCPELSTTHPVDCTCENNAYVSSNPSFQSLANSLTYSGGTWSPYTVP